MATFETIQVIATIDTSDYDRGIKKVEKGNADIEKSSESTEKKSNSAFNGIAKVGLAAVAAAAVAVGAAIVSNVGGAIKRVDTLNNANRTFQNLGFDSVQTSKSMKELEKSIMGLPTPLDSAVRGMTNLAATYGDVSLGQKVFTALNNGILGFGGTAAQVENAVAQLGQLPLDGPLDAQTWLSLQNSGFQPVFTAMAKQAGITVGALQESFGKDGTKTVKDFTDQLIKMNTDGGGGMASLETIAKDSTKGIGTAFSIMNTAITRGLANVITAIGSEDIAKLITKIGKAFENALKETSPFINFIKSNQKVITALVITMGTGIGILTAWFVAVKAITAAQLAWNAVTSANTIGLIVVSVLALAAGFMYLWNNVEGFRKFFINTWDTIRSTVESFVKYVSGVWETVGTNANNAWNTVRDAVVNAFNTIKDTVEDVTNKVEKWLYDWRTWIQNISIVIGTILLPQIVKIGIAWGISAVQAVVAFVTMATSAVVQAAITTAAWVKSATITAFTWVTKTLPRIIAGFVMTSISAVVNAVKISAAFIASSVTTLVRWGITFATMVAGFVMLGVQAIIAGGKMALGMMLALGPIGLIGAAIVGVAALIIANWDTVRGWFSSFWNWLSNMASSVARNIGDAFSSVYNWIKGLFSTIGDIGTAVIKGAVNSVLGFAERTVNNFINMINAALAAINKIPGVSIGKIGTLSIPRLAQGGIVPASPGGILANISEGGEAEAVIPLSKLDKMLDDNTSNNRGGDTITINLSGVMTRSRADLREVAKDLLRAVDEERTARGLKPINGAIA